jgi:hypothetical protein
MMWVLSMKRTARMPTRIHHLPFADHDRPYEDFATLPGIARLNWPDAVTRQWLFDHGEHFAATRDYDDLDLSRVQWELRQVAAVDLQRIPTGRSEQPFLEQVRRGHRYWLSLRQQQFKDEWELRGTWLVPPILIERQLLDLDSVGLQVVEGRMRVGILQGRMTDGLHVAPKHEAWVGRLMSGPSPFAGPP